MDFDFSPKFGQSIFEGEGGSYYSWLNSQNPVLGEFKVGAGKLVLRSNGFAFPHYGDSSKIGYVLQGTEGVVGMVLQNSSEEAILKLKKGDVIPLPSGSLSWWYNRGDTDLEVVFLGDTSKAYNPGEFTYFMLSGGISMLSGFSSEFNSKAFNLNQEQANTLVKSQTGVLIIKTPPGTTLPDPVKHLTDKMVYNIDAALHKNTSKILTGLEFPFIDESGLSVNIVRLEPGAMLPPTYTTDSMVQVVYVGRGSGRVQIVGINGKRVLDSNVEAGQLFVVPRFFVFAAIAGNEGMDCFSVMTTTRPVLEGLASKKSMLNVLSSQVFQVSFGVTPQFEQLFKSTIQNSTCLDPPPK